MKEHKMCGVHMVAFVLVIVGALNWGLVGLLNFNVIDAVLGYGVLGRLIYILVGVSGILLLMKKNCKACMAGGGAQSTDSASTPSTPHSSGSSSAPVSSASVSGSAPGPSEAPQKPPQRPPEQSQPSSDMMPPTEGSE